MTAFTVALVGGSLFLLNFPGRFVKYLFHVRNFVSYKVGAGLAEQPARCGGDHLSAVWVPSPSGRRKPEPTTSDPLSAGASGRWMAWAFGPSNGGGAQR